MSGGRRASKTPLRRGFFTSGHCRIGLLVCLKGRLLTATLLAVLGLIAMSCLISLMVLFIGGGTSGPDLEGLMLVQALSIPVAIGILAFVIALFLAAYGRRDGLALLWQAIPQWLVFGFVLLNSLTIAGELALLIMADALGTTVPLGDHVPLLALLATTSAAVALYARTQAGKAPGLSGRWSPPDGPGTRGEPWEDDL